MKDMLKLLVVGFVLAVFTSPGTAEAQDPYLEAWFELMDEIDIEATGLDLNGDGQISLYEWGFAYGQNPPVWTQEMVDSFYEIDTNGDGLITPTEWGNRPWLAPRDLFWPVVPPDPYVTPDGTIG